MKQTNPRSLLAQILNGQPVTRQQIAERSKPIKRIYGIVDEVTSRVSACIFNQNGRKFSGPMTLEECQALAPKAQVFTLLIDDL